MPAEYKPERGESQEAFLARLIRISKARDQEVDLLRQNVDKPAYVWGEYSNGSYVFRVIQKGATVTILSNRPHDHTPAIGYIVGKKLHAWGMCGTHQNGEIHWDNGAKWAKPGKVDFGAVQFFVTLEKTETCRDVGLDIEVPAASSEILKISNIKEGLMERHNLDGPARKVKSGDYIVEVNGKRGGAQILRNEVKNSETLRILISPSALDDVNDDKPKEVNIDLNAYCGDGSEAEQKDVGYITGKTSAIARDILNKNNADNAEAFLIDGHWRNAHTGRKFEVVRKNGILTISEAVGKDKIQGELRGQEDGSYVADTTGSMEGQIRLKRQNDALIFQFKRSGEEEWDAEKSFTPTVALELVFRSDTNILKTFSFAFLPLGFQLNDDLQVKHLTTGIGAEYNGVKVGWKLVNICGRNVTGKSRAETLQILDAAKAALPFKNPLPGVTYEQVQDIVAKVVEDDAESGLDPLTGLVNLHEWGLTPGDVDPFGLLTEDVDP